MRFRLQQRVTRPQLWLLQCKPQARPFPECLLHLLRLMSHNYNSRRRLQRLSVPQHVIDERQFPRAMEDFGQRGLHSRAFAGRENDYVEVGHDCRVPSTDHRRTHEA